MIPRTGCGMNARRSSSKPNTSPMLNVVGRPMEWRYFAKTSGLDSNGGQLKLSPAFVEYDPGFSSPPSSSEMEAVLLSSMGDDMIVQITAINGDSNERIDFLDCCFAELSTLYFL